MKRNKMQSKIVPNLLIMSALFFLILFKLYMFLVKELVKFKATESLLIRNNDTMNK